MTTRKKPKAPPLPAFPKVFETFRVPSYETDIQRAPSAFNGIVRVRRYRVTIEQIDEPAEVLHDRLRALWRESDRNPHYWHPMRVVAAEIGMLPEELRVEDQGADYKGKRG